MSLDCFKAYDIRGKLGEELNETIAYSIGQATACALEAKNIVVGFDARSSSPNLAQSVILGIQDAGADVINIGLAGTEEMYAAVAEFQASAGIEVTASHNPIEYNGMKLVKQKCQPLSNKEFYTIRALVEKNCFVGSKPTGSVFNKGKQARDSYIKKILSFIDISNLRPLKIVVNSGNGVAGPVIDSLVNVLGSNGLKSDLVLLHHNPDPSFPNGIPNPLIEKNRYITSSVVKKEKADFGVAFDGDFDRCFIFDHLGNFISGEYLVGVLAEIFLHKESGASIVHDRRVIWNIEEMVNNKGGKAVLSKTGHVFLKHTMRNVRAVYGGEMSAHHYFRDFFYCDSGMIPWLIIWEFLSVNNISLSQLVNDRISQFPSSGEINFKIVDTDYCIKKIKNIYWDKAVLTDEVDGLSMSFRDWRFNIRKSNTEPLLRLNVETKGDRFLLEKKTHELSNFINNCKTR